MNFVDSVWEIFGTLLQGIPLVVIPDAVVKDLHQLVDTLARTGVTRIVLPPALLQALLDTYPDLAQRVPRLKYWTNSGEALSINLAQRFQTSLPQATLLNLYGSSEVAADALCYELKSAETLSSVPIGRPLANVVVYLLDQALNLVPVGVPGEVYVGGAALARGYVHQQALTAERFVPNPLAQHAADAGGRLYRTGDLACYTPDGTIEFLGRIDHQVKLRGFRIEPGEIEAVLLEHPAVRTAVVVIGEDPATGDQRLVAYVVGEQRAENREQRTESGGAEEQTNKGTKEQGDNEPYVHPYHPPASQVSGFILHPAELRSFLKTKLPDYMIPAGFMVLDALPLTPNGKVDRRALPMPDAMRSVAPEGDALPRTAVEQILAELWASQLGLERVGVYDSFFDMGGHSLKATQLVARIRAAFQVDLSVRSLFQATTVADMAQLIVAYEERPGQAEQTAEMLTRARPTRAEQGIVTGEVPFTQYWFFEKDFPEPNRWNIATMLEVRQRLDPERARQVVRGLVEHHDALRMRYAQDQSGWRSYIVAPDEDVPFSYLDLAALPPVAQRAAIEAMAGELQGSLSLSHGPLLRVALFDLGADHPCRLLIIMHHLAGDVASLHIVLEDFHTAYQQLDRGESIVLPPKTASFKAWAGRLLAHAQTSAIKQELSYWLALPWHTVAPLPVDYPAERSANTDLSADWVNVLLDRATTQVLLQDVLAQYDAQITDVLLTALALTFAPWTNMPALLVEIVVHGRTILDDVDLSRTVGWMAAGTCAILDPGAATTPGAALQTIKAYLRQIPDSYGLLRYLCKNTEIASQIRALPTPDILFNYLGQFDHVLSEAAPFQLAQESFGRTHNEQGVRERLLDVICGITDGQLQIGWRYSQHLHRRATIERLADDFVAALRLLAAPDQPFS